MSLKNPILSVSDSAKIYFDEKGPISSSSPLGVGIVRSLRRLSKAIEALLESPQQKKLVVSISKGMSNIPRILYVAISRVPERLSAEPSVCLCFNEQGSGFVLGMMYPQNYIRTTRFPKVRREPSQINIDLSSKRSKSNFNNLFVNPREFSVLEIDEKAVTQHLFSSIDLLLEEINGN